MNQNSAKSEPEHVAIDHDRPHVTVYFSLPKGMPADEVQRIHTQLSEQKNLSLVDWTSFILNLEKHVAGRILKNENPECRITDELIALLKEYPRTPFGLTWNGGLAITYSDYRHSEKTYQRYLQNPDGMKTTEDNR